MLFLKLLRKSFKNNMSRKSKILKSANPKKSLFSFRNFMIVLVLLTAITYGKTINYGYTYFDDDAIVIRNEAFISEVSNLPKSILRDAEFQKQSIELYRPLQNISFIIDSQWVGVSSKSFHLTNLIIHFLTIIMLFFLLKEIKLGEKISFFGALIYAVHPLLAYTVSWIPARGDLLLGLFGLSTIYFYFRYLNTQKIKYLVFHFISFILALLSKESGLMILPILWFYQFIVFKNSKWNKSFFVLLAAYILVIATYLYMRSLSIVQASEGNFGIMAFIENIRTLPESIFKFLIPINIVLLPFYDMGRTLAGVVAIIFLLGLLFKTQKTELRLKLGGLFWLLILILPGMAYNPHWSEYIYNYLLHRSYFPFIGLYIFLLLLLKPWVENLKLKSLILISSGLIISLAVLNINFNKAFSSPQKFWEAAVKTNPKSAHANAYLGNAYLMDNKLSKAVTYYNLALKNKPDLKDALINRGMAKLQMNNLVEAIADLKAARKIDSTNIPSKKYLAEAYFKIKDYHNAVKLYKILDNNAIMDNGMKFNMGISLFFVKKYTDSYEFLKPLYQDNPNNLNLAKAASMAALMSNNTTDAIKINNAIVKKNEDSSTLCNLGYSYWEGNKINLALACFEKAAQLSADNIDVELGLVLCYYSLHRKDDLEKTKESILLHKPMLKIKNKGMQSLEKEGFIFTHKQKEVLKKVIEH